jgi:hypothetical protein
MITIIRSVHYVSLMGKIVKRRAFLQYSAGTAAGMVLTACGGGDGNTAPATTGATQTSQFNVVIPWNSAALKAIQLVKPGPPMAARSLAVVHTAIYDAWAAYDNVAMGTQLGATLRRPVVEQTAQNKMIAISYAAYTALLDQFPSQKSLFDDEMTMLGMQMATTNAQTAVAQQTGIAAAQACINACHVDGANQLGLLTPNGIAYADYTGFVPKNPPMLVAQPTPLSDMPAPGNWQPLSYVNATGTLVTPTYIAPFWGDVKPFAMSSASQFRPGPPAQVGTAEYLAQAQHIIDTQIALTELQKVSADYWADIAGTVLPPGHWELFAQFVSNRDQLDDDANVKLFFALSNALFDAGIAAWDAKRAYNSERPITAIRYLMNRQAITGYGPQGPVGGLMPITGDAWLPFQLMTFPTPPFAEHISGHSTFSAAAAQVLLQFTGSDAFGYSHQIPAQSLTIDPSLPSQELTLSWATFSAAAADAGMSRIYGGIHFDNANIAGQSVGRQVGALAFAKAQTYWNGTA